MPSLDFQALPLWVNLIAFAATAVVIWLAGSRLSEYADVIARRTGLGQEFIGLVLLAGATSLPEIATTVTASLGGNASLAVSNLLGGIAMQTAILAVVDFAIVRGSLSFFTPKPVLLLQGVLLVILLALVLAAVAAGEPVAVLRIGLWPIILFVAYLLVLYETYRYRGQERWLPQESEVERQVMEEREQQDKQRLQRTRRQEQRMSNLRMASVFTGVSAVILVAGWSVAQTGGALAEQTGLGQSFVGATFIAISTSLPELSTTINAARLGNYSMAFSNIFGSNALLIGLFLVSDVFHRRGLVIEAVDRSSMFAAAMGIVVTGIYLWGLLERKDKTVLRMGVDSALVLLCYGAGLIVLYRLR